jgi:hypothetical protein
MLRCVPAGRPASADEVRAVRPRLVARGLEGPQRGHRLPHGVEAHPGQARRVRHLHFKSNASQRVSHVGMWRAIVSQAHADPDMLRHLAFKDTLDRIKQSWTVGAKFYGIPESFIRVSVAACPICKAAPACQPDSAVSSPGRGKRRRRFEYTETLEMCHAGYSNWPPSTRLFFVSGRNIYGIKKKNFDRRQ